MDAHEKNKLLLNALYDSLMLVWEDNGNVMADAVRDSVMTTIASTEEMSFERVTQIIEERIEENQ